MHSDSPVLPSALSHLKTFGYAVIPLQLDASLLAAATAAIFEFCNAAPSEPHTWSRYSAANWSMVPLHHHQALWNIRQAPQLHRAYQDILGTEKLWVSIDRAGFKAPSPQSKAQPMHWDSDPRKSGRYQGLVCLTDTPKGMGGFHCMPSLFQNLSAWVSGPGDPRDPNTSKHAIIEVEAEAGSLIVWDTRLPHGGGANRGQRPRLAQYVTMSIEGSELERQQRVEWVRARRVPPSFRAFPPSVVDPCPGPAVELTPLGRKLVGVDPWP
jgi:Phytanoyl-CoA dioxygenase (PhyH)